MGGSLVKHILWMSTPGTRWNLRLVSSIHGVSSITAGAGFCSSTVGQHALRFNPQVLQVEVETAVFCYALFMAGLHTIKIGSFTGKFTQNGFLTPSTLGFTPRSQSTKNSLNPWVVHGIRRKPLNPPPFRPARSEGSVTSGSG